MDDQKKAAQMRAAARAGDQSKVLRALDQGVSVDAASRGGSTALMLACRWGELETVRLLAGRGARIDLADKKGRTALMEAAFGEDEESHLELIRFLLESGADAKPIDREGETALSRALASADENAQAIALLLLEAGSDIAAVNRSGETALYLACDNVRLEVVRELLNRGAETGRATKDLRTALHASVQPTLPALEPQLEICRLLLQAGAFVDPRDNSGRTPLMNAAFWGHLRQTELLLESGASVTVLDEYGRSALYYAKDLPTARLLVQKGADPKLRDRFGFSPIDSARENRLGDLIAFLESH